MLSFTTNGNFIDFKYTEDQYPFYEHQLTRLHNTSKCITWGYSDDTTRISFTIDDETYDNIPISSIYFDGVVMSAQADFKTNIESMFPGLAGGGSAKVYTATIAQLTGTGDNPTPVVFENSLSGTVIWTRTNLGVYDGVLSGAFPDLKTIFPPFGGPYVVLGLYNSVPFDYGYNVRRLDNDTIRVECVVSSSGLNADLYTAIVETPILIQVQVFP